MPAWVGAYVRLIDGANAAIGRVAMFILFALMGVMLWGAFARAALAPPIWTDEMGQFLMMGYFLLGGAYALQQDSAVRIDLLYSGWADRTRAIVDCVTILTLFVYLGVLLWGGIESTAYAFEYGERRRGLWRPYMAPIKVVMVTGIVLMLLQCTAIFLRDLAKAMRREL
jgi:TRAP-type mannitol/chloroaromatic compound transport system permease small subunit